MFQRILVALVFALMASTAYTQTRVGTSLIDGEIVDLYSDQSWKYRNGTNDGCEQVTMALEFCDSEQSWERIKNHDKEIAAQFRYNDRHYGQFVVEELGTSDGITSEFMRDIVISNFASFAGISDSAVIIYDVKQDTVQGRTYDTVIYGGSVSGLDAVYINTLVVSPKTTIQATTFAVSSSVSEKHKAIHESFLAGIKINLP